MVNPNFEPRESEEPFLLSTIFDFLGTIVFDDWNNYYPHIDEFIKSELDKRIEFLNFEIQKLTQTLEKFGLAEEDQLNENLLELGVSWPDMSTKEELETIRSTDYDKGNILESPASNDASTADYIEKTRKLFIPNIKYRRTDLNYKIKKIFDLKWQYERELFYLDKAESDWEIVKQEINLRFSSSQFHELRYTNRPDSKPWMNTYNPSK